MSEQHHVSIPAPLKTFIYRLIDIVSILGLLVILAATLVAIGQEILVVLEQKQVRLSDLLLLFIYMEVIAMVGIYFHSHRLPVRFPVLIAMIALARHIILETGTMSQWELVAMAASIFVLGATTVLLKYGNRFDVYEGDKLPPSS
jgi:protein PsiE